MDNQTLKHLPLESMHKSMGAKMVPFSGWNMPVQYSGIAQEHYAVRTEVGIFDVSHMGQLMIEGSEVVDFLNKVSTNNISKIIDNKAQYGLLLNQQGGVIDDIINYKISDDKFFICVNASNTDEDFLWLKKQSEELNFSNLKITNLSSKYIQLAIQGPKAMSLLEAYFGTILSSVKRFSFVIDSNHSTSEIPCIIARTGYSGEDGCEVFIPSEKGVKLWQSLFNKAEELSICLTPCGLGARDTLRLEACYPLHGHEIRSDITPLSARLEKFVSFDKDFIGRQALEFQKQVGVSPILVGLEVEEGGIIRADYPVVVSDKTVGWVTSGTMIPNILIPNILIPNIPITNISNNISSPKSKFAGKSIGLALVLPQYAELGLKCIVKFREKPIKVKIIETPFYK